MVVFEQICEILKTMYFTWVSFMVFELHLKKDVKNNYNYF